jgi:hypothetical protein
LLRTGGWLGLEFPRILREHLITLTGHAEAVDPENAAGGASFGPILRLTSIPSEVTVVGTPRLVEGEARWGRVQYQRISLAGSLLLAERTLQSAVLLDVRAVSTGAPLDVHPTLGDQHAIPGLRWGEGRGRARVVLGIDAAYPAPMAGVARLRIRTGAVADAPKHWDRARWVSGAQLGGIWRIPLGSLEVGYGHATVGDGRFDLSIGRSF